MKALFATLFVSLISITSAYAQSERKDLQVFNDIADQVNRYTQLTIFDSISASVDSGKVELTGWVTMPYKRDDLEKRVRKVDGVMTVENRIGVLPVSQFDDDLRFRIAGLAVRRRAALPHCARDLQPLVVLELRGDGQPANPRRRQSRPRHAGRRSAEQRGADAGAIAGVRLRRVRAQERFEDRRRGARGDGDEEE
jgi:hypothetical protein